MTPLTSPVPCIAVVGGGIAGLGFALALHQRGMACDVYESVPEVREIGVGITLLPHAMRELAALGLHPLWLTGFIYSIAVVVLVLARPSAPGHVLRNRSLWWLVLASGGTYACFNWGVAIGDVVRVVLLFYLMPL